MPKYYVIKLETPHVKDTLFSLFHKSYLYPLYINNSHVMFYPFYELPRGTELQASLQWLAGPWLWCFTQSTVPHAQNPKLLKDRRCKFGRANSGPLTGFSVRAVLVSCYCCLYHLKWQHWLIVCLTAAPCDKEYLVLDPEVRCVQGQLLKNGAIESIGQLTSGKCSKITKHVLFQLTMGTWQ